MTWDEFELRLIEAGWPPKEAHEERLKNENGYYDEDDGD